MRHFFDALILVTLLLVLSALPARAGVFGDGDGTNGEEDGRLGISTGGHPVPAADWYRSAGTIVCDGDIRGSATLLDIRALAPDLPGVVLATAAHVLFDLEQGRPWRQCSFDFMGLGELPGYRVPLNRRQVLLGTFSPQADPSDPSRGAGDWAFIWTGPGWTPPVAWYALTPAAREDPAELGKLALVAWDRSRGELSVAAACHAIRSGVDDLGGGSWPGQWLDDCDSDQGASGGAIVAVTAGRSELLAIRGGMHWDSQIWSPDLFPAGPPAGTRWGADSFTNYARAIDHAMLSALSDWLGELR